MARHLITIPINNNEFCLILTLKIPLCNIEVLGDTVSLGASNNLNVACICSRYNARSDWLILGNYSPVMPTGRLRARKTKAKSRINLLTSNVRSLRENLKPPPRRIDLAIVRSIRQGLRLRVSRKDRRLEVNK